MQRSYTSHPIAAVGVVLTNGQRVLLIKRGQAPKKGIWTLPGGAIELGEQAHHAAAREIFEECGVRVDVERALDVVDLIENDPQGKTRYHYVVVEYLARYKSGRLKAASDAAEARWVAPEHLEDYDLSPEALRVIRLGLTRQVSLP